MGRYSALSDLDYDLPMMMLSNVEGDVPPDADALHKATYKILGKNGQVTSITDVASRSNPVSSVGPVSSPNTKSPKPNPSKKELEEGKKIAEAYRLKHKVKIDKMPASTFVNVFPLNPKPSVETKKDIDPQRSPFAQNFQMATPPQPAPGLAPPI